MPNLFIAPLRTVDCTPTSPWRHDTFRNVIVGSGGAYNDQLSLYSDVPAGFGTKNAFLSPGAVFSTGNNYDLSTGGPDKVDN
jgi:hypothetical protein